jgi:hypothetical protein
MLFTPRSAPAPKASKHDNDSFFKSCVQTKLAIGRPGEWETLLQKHHD